MGKKKAAGKVSVNLNGTHAQGDAHSSSAIGEKVGPLVNQRPSSAAAGAR
jgi:hypothetical protein